MTPARAWLLVALAAAAGCPGRDPASPPDGDPVVPDAGVTDARPPDASPPPDAGPDAALPACSNGIDDDGDGWIDAEDPGCDHPADPDEFHINLPECGPGVPVVNITLAGMATGSFSAGAPSLTESPTCGGGGQEAVFAYSVLSGPVTLVISTDHPETTLDTVIYVRPVCQNPVGELGCDDDGAGETGGASVLNLIGVEVGTYFIFVDAFGPGSLGDFKITVTEMP